MNVHVSILICCILVVLFIMIGEREPYADILEVLQYLIPYVVILDLIVEGIHFVTHYKGVSL